MSTTARTAYARRTRPAPPPTQPTPVRRRDGRAAGIRLVIGTVLGFTALLLFVSAISYLHA